MPVLAARQETPAVTETRLPGRSHRESRGAPGIRGLCRAPLAAGSPWPSVSPVGGGFVGGLGFEQADAYQSPVVMDALDRVSVQLKFAQDRGREVNPAGAQLGKGDRL